MVNFVFNIFQKLGVNAQSISDENELKSQIKLYIEEKQHLASEDDFVFNLINDSIASARQEKNINFRN